jgi:tetratricopeptide (TPR) repeat protein
MNLQLNRGLNSGAVALRRTCAVAICLALGACASAPAKPAGSAPTPVSAQSGDSEQRNRQFQRAEALYLSGRLKEAAAAFQDLTRSHPNDARIWLKYGNTLTKLGSYDEAATAYQTAAGLDASMGGAALNLALVRLQQTRDALDVALARLAPDSPEHAEAEGLKRQITTLLGPAKPGTSTH